jgi:hypothetical protein
VCVCDCLKSEQPPSASAYGRGELAKQPRAALANIKASGCAALRAHQRPRGRSKTACTSHPQQNQYMWTLKMNAPGIRLQERSRPCTAQDARSFGLMCAFFAALLPRAAPENRTRSHKSRKNFDGPRSPVPQGECADFNARLYE